MRISLGFCRVGLVCVALVFLADISRAGLVPEQVVLVVNGDSQASLAVANEYVHLRGIPDENVVTLTGISNVEQLSVDEFRRQILGPVLKQIDERGLTSQIRCVAYSADLPTAIHVGGDVGDRKLPQILTPVASINGLTFLHRLTMAKDIRYLDLNTNFYARRVVHQSADTPWQPDELQRYAAAMQTLQSLTPKRRSADRGEPPADATRPANDPALLVAVDSLIELKRAHPQSAELLYNLACAFASTDRSDDALQTLAAAVRAGWFDHRHAARDDDFRSIRNRAEFQRLLDEMKSVKLGVQATRGFRSDIGWLPNGEPTEQAEAPRYLLSTVLAVTAGRGLTVPEAIANLRRSAVADATRPAGTVYFVRNGDVRSTTREWGFASAVDKLKSMGIDAAIEDGILPQMKSQVAGAMIGIADFDWPKSDSTILPGAIVEHLTSFGGVMTKGAGQTPLTEFLRHGAAGASGTVTEPFAIQAKFPNPFIHVHYASGCSLAEAFYQSVTGPYQLLIVGDPLCNPWRKEFRLSVEAPAADKPWQGTVSLKTKTESAAGLSTKDVSIFVDGRRINSATSGDAIELDTTTLSDGRHQITVVAQADDAVETLARWTSVISIRNAADLPNAPPTQLGFNPGKFEEIDGLVSTAISEGKLPGCVVLIGRPEGIAWLKAYGNKRVQPEMEAMTDDTVFDLASLTKPLATATSVMKLVELSKLSVDDPVAKHIPEFAVEGKEAITIRDLLLHRSGLIPDNPINDYFDGPLKAKERLFALKPIAPVRTKFLYSDVNFLVLGEVVARVSGQPLDEFARDHIFARLEMTETTYLPPESLRARSAPTEKRGERWMQGEVHDPRAHKLGGVAGHAGLFSTARDLAKYATDALAGLEHDRSRILKRDTWRAMTERQTITGTDRNGQPTQDVRGLGWDMQSRFSSNRGTKFSPRAFGHGGFTGTSIWIDPERNLYVIFLSNRVHPDGKGSVNPLAGKIGEVAVDALVR